MPQTPAHRPLRNKRTRPLCRPAARGRPGRRDNNSSLRRARASATSSALAAAAGPSPGRGSRKRLQGHPQVRGHRRGQGHTRGSLSAVRGRERPRPPRSPAIRITVTGGCRGHRAQGSGDSSSSAPARGQNQKTRDRGRPLLPRGRRKKGPRDPERGHGHVLLVSAAAGRGHRPQTEGARDSR